MWGAKGFFELLQTFCVSSNLILIYLKKRKKKNLSGSTISPSSTPRRRKERGGNRHEKKFFFFFLNPREFLKFKAFFFFLAAPYVCMYVCIYVCMYVSMFGVESSVQQLAIFYSYVASMITSWRPRSFSAFLVPMAFWRTRAERLLVAMSCCGYSSLITSLLRDAVSAW